MIKKFLAEGLNKSAIARKLGISRVLKGVMAIFLMIMSTTVINSVEHYLRHFVKMLEQTKSEIPLTVIYEEEIKKLGYNGSLRWLQ